MLLPGGGANLSPGHRFYDAAALLVQLAIDANDNGDYFPVLKYINSVYDICLHYFQVFKYTNSVYDICLPPPSPHVSAAGLRARGVLGTP